MYFEFDNDEDHLTAIEFGHVFISSQLFLVRPWHELIEHELADLKSVDMWVNLRKVPLHMWNAASLSKIASLIGKPIMMDHLTMTKAWMSFARVLVEVEVNCAYHVALPVYYKGNHVVDVEAEYSWKPQVCFECESFGHSVSKCPKAKVKAVQEQVEQIKPVNGEKQTWMVRDPKRMAIRELLG